VKNILNNLNKNTPLSLERIPLISSDISIIIVRYNSDLKEVIDIIKKSSIKKEGVDIMISKIITASQIYSDF